MPAIDFATDKWIEFEYGKKINKFAFAVNQVGPDAPVSIDEAPAAVTDAVSQCVSDTIGNDTTGDGSRSTPYKTLAKGINETDEDAPYVKVLDSAFYAEDLSGCDYDYLMGIVADTGQTPTYSLRTLDYTPSDANSIFMDKTGNDTTGTGTQALPFLTVAKSRTVCDAAHQNVVIQGDGTFEEIGFEFTGNFKELHAALGCAPVVSVKENADYFSISTIKSETTFHDASTNSVAVAGLNNGNVIIVYRDASDSDKGKFMVLESTNWTTVKSETTFHSAWTHDVGVAILKDGNVVITYRDASDSGKGKFMVLDSITWTTVKSETTFHDASTYCTGVTGLSSGNVVITFRDQDDSGKGKFIVLESINWLTVKSETTFDNGYIISTAVAGLNNGNVIIAYVEVDILDDYKGRYLVLEPTNWTVIEPKTTFRSGNTDFVGVAVLKDGNVIIDYQDYDDAYKGKYFIIEPTNWTTVKSETTFHNAYTMCTGVGVFDNGNIIIVFRDYIDSSKGKYVVLKPKVYQMLISVDVKTNGIKYTSSDKAYLEKFFYCNGFDIEAKFCEIYENESSTLNVECEAISSDSEVNLYNCLIHDNDKGIKTTEDKSIIQDSQFYRVNKGHTIDIDGAAASSGDIAIEHNDIFNNYGGIRLRNNNGTNEIVKNNIFHDNDNGSECDTEVTQSHSVNTDSNTCLANGTKVIGANPRYLNEGASNPDDIDLNIRIRLLGYQSDSPAYNIADDDRNAGSLDVKYIGEQTEWTRIRVPKPAGIDPDLTAVGAIFNINKDGSPSSKHDAQTLFIPLEWEALEHEYGDLLLAMWCDSDAGVRCYLRPDSYPDEYQLCKINKKKKLHQGVPYYVQNETVVSDIKLELARSYEP